LTPREAQERLAEILNVAERSAPASAGRTFGEACDEWLRYVEHERQRSTSTLRDYHHTVRSHLIQAFGSDTPLTSIGTEDIDAFRERLVEEGQLSRRSIQKIPVLLHGVLERAKRKQTLKRSGDSSC